MAAADGQHILVVEDNAAYRRLVVRILQGAGFKVTAAGDFADAMKAIEAGGDFTLLLSDIGMPAGTPHGFSIGAVARRQRPDLKILYMTGEHDPARFSLFAGDAPVLQKPFSSEQLVNAVTSVLHAP